MPTLAPLSPLDLNVQIPHHFRCPISLELMRDPVILSTGQTFDRSSIEKWVASGNTTCPVTMQKLEDSTLIPNHTLRRLIQEWCVANRSRGIERIPTPKQPADPDRVRSLLAEASSTGEEYRPARLFAIRALKNLAREGDRNRILMADAGTIPILIAALFSEVDELGEVTNEARSERRAAVWSKSGADGEATREGGDLSEEALGALVLLPWNDSDRLNMLQPRRLAFISSILHWGSTEARINAGALVDVLSDSKDFQEIRVVLVGTPGVMEGLVRLLGEPIHPRGVKVSMKALFSLCLRKQGKEKAVAAGATRALMERLVDADKNDAERALGTVELLCTTEEGCAAIASDVLSVRILVKAILKVSERATEYATGSLLAICSYSETVQKAAVQAGIMKELLLLIQSHSTLRAKSKAMTLLKLLRCAPWFDHHFSCVPLFGGRTHVVPF